MEYSKTTLLVRKLPASLTEQDKIDLLSHFGAQSVRPMDITGPMKHTAFARFETPELAEKCLQRLHQLEVMDQRLVVEFAKVQQEQTIPGQSENTSGSQDSSTKTAKETPTDTPVPPIKVKPDHSVDEAFVKHNISYPKKLNLWYSYPPPTVSTLTNIANALASQPRFYTQVLHLMNKMNLPCPFGAVTTSPPLTVEDHKSSFRHSGRRVEGQVESSKVPDAMEESTEESEIESDDGEGDSRPADRRKTEDGPVDSVLVRRRLKRPRKKMKLVQPDLSSMIKPSMIPKPSEVFENVEGLRAKQIMLNIPSHESLAMQTSAVNVPVGRDGELMSTETVAAGGAHTEARTMDYNATSSQSSGAEATVGGFGKVEPVNKPQQPTEETQRPDVNYKIDRELFITSEHITLGRLRQSQYKDFSVFKNYSPGDCTSRLYIKNLTKQTSEQDLVNLFGSFIDWSSPLAYNVFDIRLMKEGRMKGQAFVTLPTEEGAQKIVSECNGFILNSKPMVIQFARSAKAKEVDKPISNE